MLPPTMVAADLGPETLLDLLRHDDPLGVLSIFADVGLGGRAAEIDVRYRLTELERRLREEEPTTAALADTLARIEPELSAMLDPAGHGRGRALFVPLSGAEPTRLSTQLQLTNRVVHDERPFIHPLLECMQRGRAAGVVLLASERAEVLEWRQGIETDLDNVLQIPSVFLLASSALLHLQFFTLLTDTRGLLLESRL